MKSGCRWTDPSHPAAPWLLACAVMSPAARATDLDGTKWILATLSGRPPLVLSSITLEFDGGRIPGSDGCNHSSGVYGASGSRLRVGPNVASTTMGCQPELMQQAGVFMNALLGAQTYRTVRGVLQWRDAHEVILAAFAERSRSLSGEWRVSRINNGRRGVVSILPDTTLTVVFSTDSWVSGAGGCNHYRATSTMDGARLSLAAVASTRIMCAQPAGVMAQEQQFLQALQTVATVRIEPSRVELRRADGVLAVSLVKN